VGAEYSSALVRTVDEILGTHNLIAPGAGTLAVLQGFAPARATCRQRTSACRCRF
jgi:hypothetical protein